jgi:hypothetical protein
MSELKRYLVLVAFVAFLFAAYIQGGGTWRGHHNLRKSLPVKGATIGMQGGGEGCYEFVDELFADVGGAGPGLGERLLDLTIAGCLGFLTLSQFGDVPAR